MPTLVDFTTVSTTGLEPSPFAAALAGLRANEARYFMTKYKHQFSVESADDGSKTVEYVRRILRHGNPAGTGTEIQIRQTEIETRRHDPRFILRDQGRIRYLTAFCPRVALSVIKSP